MKMNNQTIGLFVFLALTKNFRSSQALFTVPNRRLSAIEGSCAEMKCSVDRNLDDDGAYWFWMKDAVWNKTKFTATIIYSSDHSEHPVDADFATRVNYVGTPSSRWNLNAYPPKLCSISICDLKVTDSGRYNFRFVGQTENKRWVTEPLDLRVTRNPCPITFEKPPVVRESERITLTCSTSSSCYKTLQIKELKQWNPMLMSSKQITTAYSFIANRRDDGTKFSCQTQYNRDNTLNRHINLTVQYRPWRTTISFSENDKQVKENESCTFTCKADANPAPLSYSWYHYNNNERTVSSRWEQHATNQSYLSFQRVQRTDDACYMCRATNIVGTGVYSDSLCIKVLYPPANVVLSMDTEVTEGQHITISCTVESFPLSRLTLTRTSTSNAQSPEFRFTPTYSSRQPNTLQYTFTVNPTHAGFYSCEATNRVDSNKSAQKKLVVKYRPTDVTVEARPGLTVDENASLTLHCSARSYPASSFTWIKWTDGKSETLQKTRTINIDPVSPSDSGLYSCSASNEVGTGESQQADVRVKYAPKWANITRAAERQHPDGRSSVTLSCISHSYPPVTRYSWYRKAQREESDVKVSDGQNHTVHSDQPGVYYCAAENEAGQTSSDAVQLFVGRGFMTALKFFFPFLIILLVILLLFFVYRRNKSIRGTTNTPPCFAFLGWWHCFRRRNPMEELVTAEPSGGRGALSLDQPHPDTTSKEDNAEESVVYANVSKQRPHKKKEQQEEYENVNAGHAARAPNPVNGESGDEAELGYSKVNFRAKSGHQRAVQRDLSTSDEQETHYSVVNI